MVGIRQGLAAPVFFILGLEKMSGTGILYKRQGCCPENDDQKRGITDERKNQVMDQANRKMDGYTAYCISFDGCLDNCRRFAGGVDLSFFSV